MNFVKYFLKIKQLLADLGNVLLRSPTWNAFGAMTTANLTLTAQASRNAAHNQAAETCVGVHNMKCIIFCVGKVGGYQINKFTYSKQRD